MQLAEFGSKVLLLFGQLAALGSTARLAVSAGSWAPSAVLPAGPMEKVHGLHRLVLETEEARSIMQAYDKLMAGLVQPYLSHLRPKAQATAHAI